MELNFLMVLFFNRKEHKGFTRK